MNWFNVGLVELMPEKNHKIMIYGRLCRSIAGWLIFGKNMYDILTQNNVMSELKPLSNYCNCGFWIFILIQHKKLYTLGIYCFSLQICRTVM